MGAFILEKNFPWKDLLGLSFIGVYMGLCVVIGYWVGKQVDHWLGIDPFGLITGVLLGWLLSILTIIPIIKKNLQEPGSGDD